MGKLWAPFHTLRRTRRGQALLRRGQPPRDQPGVRQAYEASPRGGESAANAPQGPGLRPRSREGYGLTGRLLGTHLAMAAHRDKRPTTATGSETVYPRHSFSIHPSRPVWFAGGVKYASSKGKQTLGATAAHPPGIRRPYKRKWGGGSSKISRPKKKGMRR